MLYRAGLAVGATWWAGTFLTHPWLVVLSGTGGTTAHDTGTLVTGFVAQTPNVTRDPSTRDTAIITIPGAPSPGGANPASGTAPDTRPAPGRTAQAGTLLSDQSQAVDVLSRVRQAYTHLDAIHVVAKFSESTILPSRTITGTDAEYEFASKRPGRFRARSRTSALEALAVSDGSNTWKALPKAKQWARLDVGALGVTGGEDQGVKAPQDFPHSIASILISRYSAVAAQAETSEILREDTYSVSGRKIGCYVLRARIQETEYQFWIDKERYLVLRDEETGTQPTQFGTGKYKADLRVSEIETGSGVEESLFKFEPDRKWVETETIILPSEKPPLLVGRAAPDFTLRSIDGGQVRLSSLRGKVVVLDFWATWCGPCRVELPVLEKLRTEFGTDVQFLGINDEEAEIARAFRKSQAYQMTILMDSKREVSHQYGVQGIPTLLVIDSHGTVRQHWVGGRGERELRSAIQAASKL